MSSCKNFTVKLSEYLDGYLVGTDKIEIEKHLQKCTKCNNEFQQIRDLKNSLSTLPKHKTSAYFEPVLYSKLRSSKSQSLNLFSNLNLKLQVPIYIGAAAILVLAGLFIGHSNITGMQVTRNSAISENSKSPQESNAGQQTANVSPSSQVNHQVMLKKSNNVVYF